MDPSHPNVRVIDLDGDGHADLLLTEDEAFRWYPSLAKDGYDAPRRVRKADNEDRGPRLVFQTENESIFLADMVGDGLTDLVRVRNGSIAYWPNRGYGRFGAKVVLAGCPRFDTPDRYDPKRVRLADIDGSGPADLIYLGPDCVRTWQNRSGNSFGPETRLDLLPGVHDAATVSVADVLGDGTACMVWSSKLLGDAVHPIRFVRLMADGKPHLLKSYKNNMGRETRLTYAPSTQFYLADRRAGRPWATRLHFPVQVLTKVEVLDHVTGWRFANEYAYHHGAYDGEEREFRGFGMVEQRDTESFSDFEAAVAPEADPAWSLKNKIRSTTYEIGPDAFTGTTYELRLAHGLAANYFVMIDGLTAASPQTAASVGVRVTGDPHGSGSLGTTSGARILELSRGSAADGDWIGNVTVVECLEDAAHGGFTLVDVVEVAIGASDASEAVSSTAWSDLDQVVLYGGPRGGGSTVASGDETTQPSLYGKLVPSSTGTVTLTRHGGGVTLVAATFTVYVVQWGDEHRIERVSVTGSTGSLGFDDEDIPNGSVTRANTWIWASGLTEGNDAADSFLGLVVVLGDGSGLSSTETKVAVGCKSAIARDVLVTVHSHPDLVVQHRGKTEGHSGVARHVFTIDGSDAPETYEEDLPVRQTSGRFALISNSHDDTSLDNEGGRFTARVRGETAVVARRTETGGDWAAYVQVVDFGALADTEEFTEDESQLAFYAPARVVKTWFHTGVWRAEPTLEAAFADEYWSGDEGAAWLSKCGLPSGLAPSELREATRALKGKALRTETFGEDESEDAGNPYAVVETRYDVRVVQERGDRRYGVYLAVPRETLTRAYERVADDPRTQHQLSLEVDDYGEVTTAATVAYRRRGETSGPQGTSLVQVTVKTVIHDDAATGHWHIGLPATEEVWQLALSSLDDDALLTVATAFSAFDGADTVDYGATIPAGDKQLLQAAETLYWNNAVDAPLTLGTVGLRALVQQKFQLAYPTAWLASTLPEVDDSMMEDAGFVQRVEDGPWWRPSGVATLDPDHFYHPTAVTDPFTNATSISWDEHDLLPVEVTDAVGNTVAAENDYQVLAPWKVTDPNGTEQQVAFDELGRVTKTAVVGGAGEGDVLATHPSTTITYEMDRWKDGDGPIYAEVQSRETHYNPGSLSTRMQVARAYSDGGGNVVLSKQKVAPGEAPVRDDEGKLLLDEDDELVLDWVEERWVGSGRVVVDNKGNPVRQYEPFFSGTGDYEDDAQLVMAGVSSTITYDPMSRKVRVDHPDGTVERVECDAWEQVSWDRIDTLNDDGNEWLAARAGLSSGPEYRARELSTALAETPSTSRLDVLGRPYETDELPGTTDIDPPNPDIFTTRMTLDLLGRTTVVTDARAIDTQTDTYDMLGRSVFSESPDAGDTWALLDVAGQPTFTWRSGGVQVRQTYDALRRPVGTYVDEGSERLHVFNVYGEFLDTDADAIHAHGRLWRQYDGAGCVESEYDFKGNTRSTTRRFLDDVDTEVDWVDLTDVLVVDVTTLDAAEGTDLVAEDFDTASTFDALNRVVTLTTPDGSVTRNTWDQGGKLESVEVSLATGGGYQPVAGGIRYNAKGQRESIAYSTGEYGAFSTRYEYDPITFRLVRLRTHRTADGKRLQDLRYIYDAAGNIVQITDDAQQTLYFNNSVVTPTTKYKYDALYRLVSAEGREHGSLGQGSWDAWTDDNPTPGDILMVSDHRDRADRSIVIAPIGGW